MYEFQGYEYHIGEIYGSNIVLVRSGIGKVNAAVSTTILFEHFKVSEVINTGAAGAIHPDFSVGDIIIADKCIHHDVDATVFGYEYGQVPRMPHYYECNPQLIETFAQIMKQLSFNYVIGMIGTGDSFMTSKEKFEGMLEHISMVDAVDMEAAAITQVCYQYKKPFIIVRAISDVVGKESNISFNDFVDLAAANSTEVLITYFKQKQEQKRTEQNA